MDGSFPKLELKVLLGLLFIVSAVLKIVGLDNFEIYVYSYHFFSLNFSFLVARAAIILELIFGFGLVFNILHKLMWWGSVTMLLGYTLLLIYAFAIGRTDSCHCFGDVLQLDPKQSLIKNGVLILLFLPIYRMENRKTRFRWLILCLVVMASIIAVFIISPPDSFTSNSNPEQNLNVELFNDAMTDAPLDSLDLMEGKQVVGLFSTGCEYCRMAARKLSLMQQFYGFPAERVTYIFMGSDEGVARFYELSESVRYRDVLYLDAVRLLKCVNGNFPVIVLMDNGEVIHEYGFRNMQEDEIKAFMAF